VSRSSAGTRGLLDTSVFIAAESGRPLDVQQLPDEAAVSVITIAALQAGVLAAADVPTRAARMSTLGALSDVEVLPVDEAAARVWAQMRVQLAEQGRRVNVNDLWIAAIAASRGLPVVTQDDDFAAVEGMAGLVVVRV
jgi:predicted nucleic acid-binding protein